MKISFSIQEAQQVIGKAVKDSLPGSLTEGLEVTSVEWDRYGSSVEVVLSKPDRGAE